MGNCSRRHHSEPDEQEKPEPDEPDEQENDERDEQEKPEPVEPDEPNFSPKSDWGCEAVSPAGLGAGPPCPERPRWTVDGNNSCTI
jgi:hypothetical protein